MNQRCQNLLDKWWNKACPIHYWDLEIQIRWRQPPDLSLPRRLFYELIASQTGHGNLADYHRRFQHEVARLDCICGKETSPTHFTRCQNHRYLARKLTRYRPHGLLVNKFLGPKCLKSFTNFMYSYYRYHSFPKSITSVRGPQWVGQFWKRLCHLAGIEQKLLSTYLPQTDDGTERWNHEVWTYLRAYVN